MYDLRLTLEMPLVECVLGFILVFSRFDIEFWRGFALSFKDLDF